MKRTFMWAALSLVLVLMGVAGYYSYSVYHFANAIHKKPGQSLFPQTPGMTTTSQTNLPPKWEGKDQVNILLLGGDSRGLAKNEIPRSDSIMVASINPVTKKAYLFSVLRDTWVNIPGHGQDRINAAVAIGGPDLAMKTVGNLLDIPIQYYVYTDFKGFIALIDALGGIDIDVEKDMNYTDAADDHEYDIHLKKGLQHLDGQTALEYVRFRHDAMSDFARSERQRKFLTALAQELKSSWSIVKLPKILNAIDPYIETNLSVTDMLKLASLGMSADTGNVDKEQLPPMDMLQEKTVNGASVLGVDPAKLQTYVHQLYGDRTVFPPAGSDAQVNAGESAGTRRYSAEPAQPKASDSSTSRAEGTTSSSRAGSGAKPRSTGAKAGSSEMKTSGSTAEAGNSGTKTSSTSSEAGTTGAKMSSTSSEAGTTGAKTSSTSAEAGTTGAKPSGTSAEAGTTATKTSGSPVETGTTATKTSSTSAEAGTTTTKMSSTSAETGTTGTKVE